MKYKKSISIYLVLTLLIVGIFAMGSIASAKEVTVRAGQIIYVENLNTLDPSNLSTGDNIELVTVSDVVVDDVIIIEAGTPISATVNEAQGEGALGKAGKLSISANSVQAVDGTIIGLSGSKTLAGESKGTEAVGGGLFLCAPMLLMKGGGVEIPQGSIIECRVMSTHTITVN